MSQTEEASAKHGEQGAAHGPVQGQFVGMREAGAAHGVVGVDRHTDQRHRLKCTEETAQWKPVMGDADPVIMVGGAKDTGNEHQADNHVQPLLHDLAISTGQSDQQIGQKAALDHFPDTFDPQVNRPPAVVDRYHVVFIMQQCRQIKHGGTGQAQQKNAFGGSETPGFLDGHADVVEKHQHADHDHDLVRQRLFEQFVPGAITEQIAQHGGDPHGRPQPELDIRQFGAVQLATGLVRHHPVGCPP